MLRSLRSLLPRSLTPLAARLVKTNESSVEGWVRLKQHEPDVASDALALLIMMAAGRFLNSHLNPPPRYLGKIHMDVLAYEVLRYVKSAVGEHLPETRVLLRVNSDVLLKQFVERETRWKVKSMDFGDYASRERDLAEEFLQRLEQLNGLAKPEFISFSYLPIKPDFAARLRLMAAIAAFQQTIPQAVVEVLEELIRLFNLNVERDDRLEALISGFNQDK